MNSSSSHTMDLSWLGDVTIQSTLILGLAALALLFRLSASRRHFILAAGLLSIPGLMVGTGLGPVWRLFPAPASVVVSMPLPVKTPAAFLQDETGQQKAAIVTEQPIGEMPKISVPPAAAPSRYLQTLAGKAALAIWILGITAGLLLLAVSAWQLRRLRQKASAITIGELHRLFERCRSEAGLSHRQIELLLGPAGTVPMTWGVRRQVVMIPEDAMHWSEARVLLVLRHELAHISRHDIPVSVLTNLSALILWFHPLVWFVWRASNQVREAACDDLAFKHSGTPSEDFASELLQAITTTGARPARLFTPLALAMAEADKVALKKRLASILNEEQRRTPWGRKSRYSLSFMAVVVVFLFTGLSACREDKKEASPATAPAVAATKPFSGNQLQISSKVFSLPMTSSVLEEFGLKVDPVNGVQLGVIDAGKATLLLERLKTVQGAALIAAPSVVTRYGQKAEVSVVQEFIYPTEFDPPHLPEAKEIIKPITLEPGQAIPVFPTTPTAFETRPVGLRMDFIPVLSGDGQVDLDMTSEFTTFEGFINYGAPIKGNAMGPDGKIHEITLTENKVQQPIFHSSKCQTSVTFREGDYLVMGGLGAKSHDATPNTKKPDLDHAALTNNANRDLIFFVIQPKNVPAR